VKVRQGLPSLRAWVAAICFPLLLVALDAAA